VGPVAVVTVLKVVAVFEELVDLDDTAVVVG
jgi:hypothetical protein